MKRLIFVIPLLLCATGVKAQMSAHYINVGQAESILLEFKNAAILIDAGGEATGNDRDKNHLVGYLNRFFARRIDLNRRLTILISHPHIDHTKNLGAVIQSFNIQRMLDGGNQSGSGIGPLRAARTRLGRRYRALTDAQITARGRGGFRPFPELMQSSEIDLRILAASRGVQTGTTIL
jgi:beta-lactamase superfamily II metal-dependent hydrolase